MRPPTTSGLFLEFLEVRDLEMALNRLLYRFSRKAFPDFELVQVHI